MIDRKPKKVKIQISTYILIETWKKYRTRKVTVVSIVDEPLGKTPKCLAKKFKELEIQWRNDSIQATFLF